MLKILLHAILLLITGGIVTPIQGAGIWDTNMSPVDRFINFVTDVPPIDNMVCSFESRHMRHTIYQMRYRASDKLFQWPEKTNFPPSAVRFRYKPQYFICRNIDSIDDSDSPLAVNRQAVGVWNDEYWFLNPSSHAGHRASLYLYHYEPEDWGTALYGFAVNMQMFTLFTSFGISGSGSECLVKGKEGLLEYIYNSNRYPIEIKVENGVPVQAKMKRQMDVPGGYIEADILINYAYDTNIAPLGIPVQFIMPIGRSTGNIHLLKLGNSYETLPKEVIMPNYLLTNPTLSRIIRTNRTDYHISAQGKWRRMDLSPEQAMAQLEGLRHKNRKYYLLIAALFTLLLAPAIVARVKTKQ